MALSELFYVEQTWIAGIVWFPPLQSVRPTVTCFQSHRLNFLQALGCKGSLEIWTGPPLKKLNTASPDTWCLNQEEINHWDYKGFIWSDGCALDMLRFSCVLLWICARKSEELRQSAWSFYVTWTESAPSRSNNRYVYHLQVLTN